MVNKKFRPFMKGICISMSAMVCAATMVPPVAFGAETEATEAQTEAGGLVEGAAPMIMAAENENGGNTNRTPETPEVKETKETPGQQEPAPPKIEISNESQEGGNESGGNQNNNASDGDGITIVEQGTQDTEPGETTPEEPGEPSEEDGTEEKSSFAFSQDVENPSAADPVKVTAKLSLKKDQETAERITFTFDGKTKVNSFGCAGVEGTIQVIHEAGVGEFALGEAVDVSGLNGIISITVTPTNPMKAGDVVFTMDVQAAEEKQWPSP